METKTAVVAREIRSYHQTFSSAEKAICRILLEQISEQLPDAENKIWHRHPVWFLNGNPVAGYSKLKDGICLMFWSGQSFDEPGLSAEGSFKAATVCYTSAGEIKKTVLKRWLKKARNIQWDYKNIVKRKGVLVKL